MSPPQDADETLLERLLAAAHLEPGRRPEFYRHLLDSTILALVEPLPGQRGNSIPAGSTIQVENWLSDDGVWVVPFFSSPDALFRAFPEGRVCAPLTGRELFEGTIGLTLHLNPQSERDRRFSPWEIESLLRTGAIPGSFREIMEQNVEITLRAPTNPSTDLLRSLRLLYARLSNVKAAYVADMTVVGHNDPPRLLLGLEVEADYPSAVRETGIVVNETHRGYRAIDTIKIARGRAGLSDNFLSVASCFFERGPEPWRSATPPSDLQTN
jgi:hypothetical protein